ncbi:CATRA system-associated protein [Streptomyces phaeochromogenes]
MGAMIGRDLARDVERALRALLDWRLPPEAWDETAQLLTDLGAAVDKGDAETVDELTALLETSGRRVGRMGNDTRKPAASDGRTPAPQPVRERAVAVLHAVERSSGSGRDGSGPPAEGGARPSGT